MPLPNPLAVCIGGVFCCSLLALHLLWLATLHRRAQPSVVTGEMAFAVTLVGLSGFLLVGGSVAASYGHAWSASGRADTYDATWGQVVRQPAVRMGSLAVYGACLAVVAGVGFWNRRDSLEAFNIDPTALPTAVEEAAAAVGLGDSRAIRWAVRPSAGHATVWVRRLDPAVSEDLLAALIQKLAVAPIPARSAGGWYTAVAGGLLGITVALFLAFFRITRQI